MDSRSTTGHVTQWRVESLRTDVIVFKLLGLYAIISLVVALTQLLTALVTGSDSTLIHLFSVMGSLFIWTMVTGSCAALQESLRV